MTTCSQVSVWLWMTLMTMTKRGTVKARTGMRTQDPRLAQHRDLGSAFTELAAKGRRKARLLSARDALQSDPSSQKRGRTMAPSGGRLGAEAPSSQSRRHERKHLHPYNNDVLDVVQLQVSQEDAQSLLQFATCTISGYIAMNYDQTGYIDYTGEKFVDLASDLSANLEYNIKIIKNLLDITMTRKILRGAGNVAVLCALSGNNSLQFHEAAAVLLGVQTAAPQFAIGRHKAQKNQEIPHIAKKDERDDSEAKRKCDLGNSGIIKPRGRRQSARCVR